MIVQLRIRLNINTEKRNDGMDSVEDMAHARKQCLQWITEFVDPYAVDRDQLLKIFKSNCVCIWLWARMIQ